MSLLQHVLDSHSNEEIPKRIGRRYHFPCKCEHCNCTIKSAIALLSHYSSLHNEQVQEVFNLAFGGARSAASAIPRLLDDRDTQSIEHIREILEGEPNVCVVPEGIKFTIISGNGIHQVTTGNVCWKLICQLLKEKRIVLYGQMEDEDRFAEMIGVDPSQFFSSAIFTTLDFIWSVIASGEKDPYTILQGYLSQRHFFPVSARLKCPLCEQEYSDEMGVYRCLYRKHPFPQYVMGQFKEDTAVANEFCCSKCHCRYDNFDQLLTHVVAEHWQALCLRTLDECDKHALKDRVTAGRVKEWINAARSAPKISGAYTHLENEVTRSMPPGYQQPILPESGQFSRSQPGQRPMVTPQAPSSVGLAYADPGYQMQPSINPQAPMSAAFSGRNSGVLRVPQGQGNLGSPEQASQSLPGQQPVVLSGCQIQDQKAMSQPLPGQNPGLPVQQGQNLGGVPVQLAGQNPMAPSQEQNPGMIQGQMPQSIPGQNPQEAIPGAMPAMQATFAGHLPDGRNVYACPGIPYYFLIENGQAIPVQVAAQG